MELLLLSAMYSVPAFVIAVLCLKYDDSNARITRKEVLLALIFSLVPYINIVVLIIGGLYLIARMVQKLWNSRWFNQDSTLFNLKIKKVQKYER